MFFKGYHSCTDNRGKPWPAAVHGLNGLLALGDSDMNVTAEDDLFASER